MEENPVSVTVPHFIGPLFDLPLPKHQGEHHAHTWTVTLKRLSVKDRIPKLLQHGQSQPGIL